MGARGTGKFFGVPYWDHGCIYAVEFSNGVVKVGMTEFPQSRLYGLNQEFRKRHEAVITRYHIGPDIGQRGMLRQAENLLIAATSESGRAFMKTREYFEGVAFDCVAALVDGVSRQFMRKPATPRRAPSPQPQSTKPTAAPLEA